MTDSRKSIFFPQVSLLSSVPMCPTRSPGDGMMEELVYWTPFWSFTRINSTSFFSALHWFSGATDESLCSGIMFIFSGAYDVQAALTAPSGFWKSRLSEPEQLNKVGNHADNKRIKNCSSPRLEQKPPRTWAEKEQRETLSLCVNFHNVLRTARIRSCQKPVCWKQYIFNMKILYL